MRAVARLGAFRARAESRMLSTFAVKVPTGTAFNGTDDVTTYGDLFTTRGRVKVLPGVRGDQISDVGDRTAVTVIRELHIPVSSPAIPTNAVAVCTAVDSTADPTLLGAMLRLAGPGPGDQTTARRLKVTEVVT